MSKDGPELSREQLETLLEALAPAGVEPPADLRARVLMRVARSVEGQEGMTVVRADGGEWRECVPGLHAKTLYDDGITRTWLARCDPGAAIADHDHAVDEEVLVLEGSIFVGDIELKAGDHLLTRVGARHGGAVHSPAGCLVLMRTASDARFVPA